MKIPNSPCVTCPRGDHCVKTATCGKWRCWFYKVWPVVTGRKKPNIDVEIEYDGFCSYGERRSDD